MNLPLIIDIDSDTSSSSVGSNFEAEVNANDYLRNHVPVPNVNLPTEREEEDEEIIFERESDINRWIDKHIREDDDLDHVNDVFTDTSELPSGFIFDIRLRRYQKEFLAWGLKQEQSAVRGGILADEMGMGNRIQAIYLVLAKRAIDKAQSDDETMGYTLVICSTNGLSLWSDELAQFTFAKVLNYDGLTNNEITEEFRNYDFVLTTYCTVTSECKYIGPSDVEVDRGMSPLHSVQWNRIILDEVITRSVHTITNIFSRTTKAVFALEATYRWALTSTPLLNNLDNLYSLMCFLHTRRYSPYFCNPCDCEPSNHSVYGRLCPNCGHSENGYRYWWNKFVADPIEENRNSMEVKRAKILLKHKVLKGILIRRTNLGQAAHHHS